jgi:hypothetical protein
VFWKARTKQEQQKKENETWMYKEPIEYDM